MEDDIPAGSGSTVSIHKALVHNLSQSHKGLNIFHFNARSLNGNKLDYVRYIFENEKVDVLCVSETWFDCVIPDSVYSIPGFRLFRNDRVGKRGGGVAVYCRDKLNSKLVSKSSDTLIEYLNIEIFSQAKVLISCVYNPLRLNSPQLFFSELNDVLIDFDYYIVCGDFNINLLTNDPYSSSFNDFAAAAGLSVVNNSVPTRYSHNTTPSLLDVFLVSDLSLLIKFDQISFVSDHDLIFCSFNLTTGRALSNSQYMFRDYRRINVHSLFTELASVLWSDCWECVSVDDKLDWLMSVVMRSFDRHVPLKKVKPKSSSVPCFTSEVLVAIKQRNILHSRWKRNPTEHNWSNFTSSRNVVTSIIKRAKCSYFSSLLSTSIPPKQLWRNIRKLNITGRVSEPCLLDPNELNQHFVGVVDHDQPITSARYSCSIENPFDFMPVSESDVARHIASIKSNAIGYDGLSLRFIKIILPFILPTITHIINHCITTSTFPNLWKVATITPVAKKASARDLNDFRPISILPALAKVFERIMSEQITKYLNMRQLLSPLQSGFRVGHSCSTAMVKILDDIRAPYDKNQLTLLCLLDFSKAFDTVDHKILCSKLEYDYHFSVNSTKLLCSYLQHRLQRVRILNDYSSFVEVIAGVPQGSTLGPLLFSMFVNDILSVCKFVTLHAYADDIQMYISDDFCHVTDMVEKLNSDLSRICDWAVANGLSLNINKSVVLPISYKVFNFRDIPPIVIGLGQLKLLSSVRNLGYVLNNKLTCHDHVNLVVCKIFMVLRTLRRTASYTPVDVKRNLVLQLIMPYIQYFCVVFSKLDSVSSQKLNVAFNNAVRYVYSLRKFDHVAMYKDSIVGVGLNDYIVIRNMLFLHNLLRTGTPGYLRDKIKLCRSARTLPILIPRFVHLSSCRLFFVNGVRAWNSLPVAIRTIADSSAFRSAIYKHFSTPSPFS